MNGISVCLVQGTAIEATLWRELAERYFDTLEEGKVWRQLQNRKF